MRRDVSVEDISDGRRYRSDDLVKIGTNGCSGCCDCCRMDPVIVLDPWDVYMLQKGTGLGLEKLLNNTVKLDVIDGLIQPVLKMAGGACPYLGADGRCEIHAFRPGICRLYPLGRSWEPVSDAESRSHAGAGSSAITRPARAGDVPNTEDERLRERLRYGQEDFSYILQINECTHCTGSKVKIKKWLGIPDLPRYEDYCREWHTFLKEARTLCEMEERRASAPSAGQPAQAPSARATSAGGPSAGQPAPSSGQPVSGNGGSVIRKIVCMQILEKCYLAEYDIGQDFYPQFERQLAEARRSCGLSTAG